MVDVNTTKIVKPIYIISIVVALLCVGVAIWQVFSTNPQLSPGNESQSLKSRQSGVVVAWGSTMFGRCDVPLGLNNVTDIAAGMSHNLAILKNGTVVAWGYNGFGQCAVPPNITPATAIAAGDVHSMALLQNGTVVAWGDNRSGQCAIPPEIQGRVKAIDAQYSESRAILTNGTVVEWGNDRPWVQYTNAPANAIAGEIILLQNGTVTALNADGSDIPVNLKGVVAISSRLGHHLALKEDGTVVAWGFIGGGGKWMHPVTVPDWLAGRKVLAVAAGGYHNAAIVAD